MASEGGIDTFKAWRDELNYWPSDDWSADVDGGAVVEMDGNAAGSRYLRCTLDPRNPNSVVNLSGRNSLSLRPPMRAGYGVTLSRRSTMQQLVAGVGGVGGDWPTGSDPDLSPAIDLTGSAVVASNVATYSTVGAHSYSVGDRISVYDCADPRINGLLVITGIPTASSFTVGLSIANGSYSAANGHAVYIPAALSVTDFIGVIADDTTAGNAKFVSRSTGSQRYVRSWNPGATWDSSVVPSGYSAKYTYPHQSRYTLEFLHEGDWAGATLHSVDSTSGAMGTVSIDQQLPNPGLRYVPKFQWRNLPHLPVPIPITQIVKTGSAVATVKAPSHGLTASAWVTIWGVRDQASFANFSTPVQVASIVDADTFTISFGASTTATSYGGFVAVASTSLAMPFAASSSVQTLSTSATGRLLVQFLASQGTLTIGESVCLVGLVDSTQTRYQMYEGLYRVASTDTTLFQVELEPIQSQQLPGSTQFLGGALLGAPDLRIHYARGRECGRTAVEITTSRAHGRQMSSVPVYSNGGSVSVSGTAGVNMTLMAGAAVSTALDNGGTNRLQGVFLGAGSSNADKTSGAVTGAGTSSVSVAPGQAIVGLITVTGTSGTNPTLDISLEESFDNGTTWQKIYDVPRITGNGTTLTPPMLSYGRTRWTWPAPGGTTPSFTVAINSMRSSIAQGIIRQLIDRAIAPNTANSASGQIYVEGCSKFGLVVVSGAGATSSPVYRVQFSPDGANWVNSTETLTVPASSTLATAVTCPFNAKFARIQIATAGTAAVQSYAMLTAMSS